jgi:hypothetical protein
MTIVSRIGAPRTFIRKRVSLNNGFIKRVIKHVVIQ